MNWLRLLVPKDSVNGSGYAFYGNCNYDASHKRVSFTFNVVNANNYARCDFAPAKNIRNVKLLIVR